MAMINCRECGKEVSDLAEKCPNCGASIKIINTTLQMKSAQPENKNSKLGIAALIFSVMGCTFMVGIILAIIDLVKKDGNKKTLSIVSLIICGLWVLLALASSSVNKNTTNETNNNITIEEETEPETGSEIEIETDSNTEIFNSENEEDLQDKYHVGDTWQNRYVNISFDSCGEYESDNQFVQPAVGNKYIFATFTFENIGSSDHTVAYWDFECYADGYACDQMYYADGATFIQTLSSGRKVTGSVYFEVPENVTEIEIEFSPSSWTYEKVIFVVE